MSTPSTASINTAVQYQSIGNMQNQCAWVDRCLLLVDLPPSFKSTARIITQIGSNKYRQDKSVWVVCHLSVQCPKSVLSINRRELGQNNDDPGVYCHAVRDKYTWCKQYSPRETWNCWVSWEIWSSSFTRRFPKKKMGSTLLLPFPYVSSSSAENISLALNPFIQRLGGSSVSCFGYILVICQMSGTGCVSGKEKWRLSFPKSAVCFSLSQSVRGNKNNSQNGYNHILVVLERHWRLNKGSHQK